MVWRSADVHPDPGPLGPFVLDASSLLKSSVEDVYGAEEGLPMLVRRKHRCGGKQLEWGFSSVLGVGFIVCMICHCQSERP